MKLALSFATKEIVQAMIQTLMLFQKKSDNTCNRKEHTLRVLRLEKKNSGFRFKKVAI